MEKMMIAFHGRADLKDAVLVQLALHREADKLVKGQYWERGKGCAVGCTIESIRLFEKLGSDVEHDNHALYERYLGVPEALARIEDGIFEGLPNGLSQAWPERFLSAIRPGADLSMVIPRFLHWLLTDPDGGVARGIARRPQIKPAIDAVAELYRRWLETGAKPSVTEWREARKDAAYAAAAAYAADAAAAAADAAYAAAAAADAAAADAADAARTRDRVLATYAEWVVEILIDMNAPGCQWLDLVPKAA